MRFIKSDFESTELKQIPIRNYASAYVWYPKDDTMKLLFVDKKHNEMRHPLLRNQVLLDSSVPFTILDEEQIKTINRDETFNQFPKRCFQNQSFSLLVEAKNPEHMAILLHYIHYRGAIRDAEGIRDDDYILDSDNAYDCRGIMKALKAPRLVQSIMHKLDIESGLDSWLYPFELYRRFKTIAACTKLQKLNKILERIAVLIDEPSEIAFRGGQGIHITLLKRLNILLVK